jgi:hypothetical protein
MIQGMKTSAACMGRARSSFNFGEAFYVGGEDSTIRRLWWLMFVHCSKEWSAIEPAGCACYLNRILAIMPLSS